MKRVLTIILVAIINLVMISCGNGAFGGKSWDTIEDVRKNIDGTVWTYTQPNDVWIKLEFKNGKCYVYTSNQSKCSWGEAKCEDYIINEYIEKRTNEKIVMVSIGHHYDAYFQIQTGLNFGYFYELSPKEEILYLKGSPLSVHPTDYKW